MIKCDVTETVPWVQCLKIPKGLRCAQHQESKMGHIFIIENVEVIVQNPFLEECIVQLKLCGTVPKNFNISSSHKSISMYGLTQGWHLYYWPHFEPVTIAQLVTYCWGLNEPYKEKIIIMINGKENILI